MANIFVRSPYIVSINETGQVSSKIEIYLWNGTGSAPATPQYTLSKAIPSDTNTNTSYDISPYVREYLSHVATQSPVALSTSFTNLTSTQWCNVKVKKYYKLIIDGEVTNDFLLGEVTHYAHDGYSFYESGANFDHGRFLLEQKEYFYNEDATYAGEVACYLNSGEKVKYGNDFTSSTATINSTPIFGGFRKITSVSVTGDYTAEATTGVALYFTYEYEAGQPITSWTGTVLSSVYNSGTNITTITPNFGGTDIIIEGGLSNSGNRTVTAGDSELYTVSTSGWYTIPRISGDLTILRIYNSALSTLYASWTFTPICEPKYTPVVIDFINKYGAWQREFFFKASKTNISIESNDYNVMQSSASAYDVLQGQKRSFNTNGMETISVNSGYVNEDFSSNIKQLLMSERILVDNKPAICKTKSLELMKNINNHMINYSLEFEFAYNSINNVI
jgi:hypothetical protein